MSSITITTTMIWTSLTALTGSTDHSGEVQSFLTTGTMGTHHSIQDFTEVTVTAVLAGAMIPGITAAGDILTMDTILHSILDLAVIGVMDMAIITTDIMMVTMVVATDMAVAITAITKLPEEDQPI